MRRILVGSDGSDTARRAEAAAQRLASRMGAELQVANVSQPNRKRTAWELMEIADRSEADLLVIGSRTMRGLRALLLGSVPDQVSHEARGHVLLVRTEQDRPAWGEYRTILVGTDGSPTADRACRIASDFASGLGAKLVLAYAGHPVTARNVLEDTARQLGHPGELDTMILSGEPSSALVDAAKRAPADVIVVGSRGMAGPQRVPLGSVPNKVSHRSPIDVFIAKTYLLSLSDVQPGEGAIVAHQGRKLAVYREEDGSTHVLSAKCRHLGCTVGWNSGDRTWDCPCHGSRYARDGRVIHGPATESLPRVDAGPRRA